jgi:hypothetical protein
MPDRDRVEERHAIAAAQVTLFLIGHGPGTWQVWLDFKQDFDGVRVGVGASREDAISNAVDVLLEGVRALRVLGAVASNGKP